MKSFYDAINFDDINSHRTRLGARYCYAVSPIILPYIGVAWDHEFDGDATYSTLNTTAGTPTIEGDTGILELGLSFNSSKDAAWPFSVDFGVEGYTGVRKGFSGNIRLNFEF